MITRINVDMEACDTLIKKGMQGLIVNVGEVVLVKDKRCFL